MNKESSYKNFEGKKISKRSILEGKPWLYHKEYHVGGLCLLMAFGEEQGMVEAFQLKRKLWIPKEDGFNPSWAQDQAKCFKQFFLFNESLVKEILFLPFQIYMPKKFPLFTVETTNQRNFSREVRKLFLSSPFLLL